MWFISTSFIALLWHPSFNPQLILIHHFCLCAGVTWRVCSKTRDFRGQFYDQDGSCTASSRALWVVGCRVNQTSCSASNERVPLYLILFIVLEPEPLEPLSLVCRCYDVNFSGLLCVELPFLWCDLAVVWIESTICFVDVIIVLGAAVKFYNSTVIE